MGASWSDPWHTLTVTVKHFHHYEDCQGHDAPNLWGVETGPDVVKKELVHPDSCKDISSEQFEYRCATEYDVLDNYADVNGPFVSGTYRVRTSGWGPDLNGDYDAQTEFEPIGAGS